MRKTAETRSSLGNTIKGTSLPEYGIICKEGLRTIVLVSLIELLGKLLDSTIFRIVHPYTIIHSVE